MKTTNVASVAKSEHARRSTKPRPIPPHAVAVVTQLTSLAVVGMDPRRFCEAVRTKKIPHARIGKLVLVDVEIFRKKLAEMASEETDVSAPPDADDELDSADAVLAQIGHRRVLARSR